MPLIATRLGPHEIVSAVDPAGAPDVGRVLSFGSAAGSAMQIYSKSPTITSPAMTQAEMLNWFVGLEK